MAASVDHPVSVVADSGAGKGGRRGQQVVEILRSAIIMGNYEPGERLIEATLSTELGTSRGPVREALRQLENEGLVMSFPYRGAVVLGVSDEEVQEVLIPIRLTLERYSFMHALDRITEADFAEMGKQVWLMEQAAAADDLSRLVEADLRFHDIVISASGQTHTVQIWRTIWPRIRAYFYRYGRGQDLATMVDEHRDLLRALQSRDPEILLAQLKLHIAVPAPRHGLGSPEGGRRRTPQASQIHRKGQVMSELLNVSNLRTGFHTHGGVIRAVDGVDFTIDTGGALGVVGESGSGKSVTALSVMRLIDPPGNIESSSSIMFDGRELTALDDEEMTSIRGNDISMIFQEPMTSLNPVFTVGDQIAEAVQLHQNVDKKEAEARAVEMMRLVGIPSAEKRVRDYPHQMSGGMRQRVMIGMALSCNPKLLIADEPTTALDVTVQAQILELMKELRQKLGMAILLITHDLGVVAEMVDEVAVMYGGKVVERGPVKEIFASPQHPYTEALLRSMPLLGMRYTTPLKAISGMVPSPLDWPNGCRFAPRCDYAFERCVEELPPLFDVGQQESACWLCKDGPRKTEPIGVSS